MNVLMLGNGFDLNYELPTKYINFLNTVSFASQAEKSTFTLGTFFGDKELQAKDKGIANSYSKYHDVYDSIDIDPDVVDKLKSLARNNIWFSYLLKSFNKDIGWIDFEREISTVLHSFQDFLPELKVRFQGGDLPDNRINRYILETFDFFYTKISDYGVTSSGKYYAAEYSVIDEFIIEYPFGSGNKVINKEKIVAVFEKALLELAEVLKLYLIYFVGNTVAELCKRKTIKPFPALSDAQYVITFNYTDTYEQVYRSGAVFHIHGCLQDRIILGVNPDDADQIETVDTLFLPFKKYYQRVINRSDAGYLDWISQDNENISLVVMGHSLDVTDQDIITQIFEIASDITVLYYDEKTEASLVANLVKIYGKEKFDELRLIKRLRFLPQNASYAGFAEDRKAKEQAAMADLYRHLL